MEYKLRITDIMTLRPYMFVIGGVLLGCVVAWLLINYVRCQTKVHNWNLN